MNMLINLPDELLAVVLDALDVREVKQLSLVSGTFSARCRPRLYHSVVFTSEGHHNQEPPPLHSFLRSVLFFPDRASLVRKFILVSDRPGNPWRDLDPLEPAELAIATQVLFDAGFNMTAKLLSALESGNSSSLDAAIALLLLILPNLRVINLGVCFSPFRSSSFAVGSTILTPAMFRHIIRESSPVGGPQSLETIQYYSDPDYPKDEDIPNFTDVLWLFYVPSIKNLAIRAVDHNLPFQWPLAAPFLPALHTLNLQNSHVQLQTLETLLSWLPHVRRLEYHCYFNCRKFPEYFLDCIHLREVLETRSDALEELVLSVRFYGREAPSDTSFWDNIGYGIHGSLGDMNRFTNLKYLKAPVILLLGWDSSTQATLAGNLPASLQELCCTNDMSEYDLIPWNYDGHAHDQIRSFLFSRAGILQKFIVGAERGRRLWDRGVIQSLWKACNHGGIAFDIIRDPWEEY
ncbi:MAG: hypothetical protein Q9225_005490 [Loekoesia sp. 1 TL-2023]